jgi:hypothetical protein
VIALLSVLPSEERLERRQQAKQPGRAPVGERARPRALHGRYRNEQGGRRASRLARDGLAAWDHVDLRVVNPEVDAGAEEGVLGEVVETRLDVPLPCVVDPEVDGGAEEA